MPRRTFVTSSSRARFSPLTSRNGRKNGPLSFGGPTSCIGINRARDGDTGGGADPVGAGGALCTLQVHETLATSKFFTHRPAPLLLRHRKHGWAATSRLFQRRC